MLENRWRSKFVLFLSWRVSSLLSLYKKWIYYFIFHQYTHLKKIRLKNNLSKSNQKLRDVITKNKYDNQVIFKKWLWKNL